MTTDVDITAKHVARPSPAFVVAVLTACVAVCYGFGISLFSQIVPDMRADLHFDYGFVGTVTALVQLSTVVGAILAAWLAPRVGAAQMVIAAVSVCGICLLLVPWTSDVVVVGILLTVMGGTGASAFVPMINLVSRVVMPNQRGFVMSVISSAPSYGVVTNSLLVPIFAGSGNWQAVWSIVGTAAVVLALAGSWLFYRVGLFQQIDTGGETVDATSPASGIRSTMPWVLLILALSFFNGFAPYPYLGFLSSYLREELGYSVSYAAWLWGAIGVVGILSGFLVGSISSRLSTKSAILFCYVNFFIAGLILALSPSPALSLLSGVLFSLGFYPIYGLLPAYVSHRTSAVTAITIFGVSTVIQGLGGAIGNYSAGLLKVFSGGFSGIYLAFAVAGLVSTILTLVLPRQNAKRTVRP